MKKLITLILLLPVLASAQLSGTYLVGTGQASPFNNLPNAIARINSVGVSGPVVFSLVSDVTVTEPLTINAYTGSSATNTLTIKPAATKTITITVNNANGFTGIPAVIKCNGASNIIIDGSNTANGNTRNLTLNNANSVVYVNQSVVWISSNNAVGSFNVTVKNTILKNNAKNQAGNWCLGVYSGSNTVGGNSSLGMAAATGANSSTTLSNNLFVNVKEGIYINGSASSGLKSGNITINANTIGSTVDAEKPFLGMNLINVNGFSIQSNALVGILNNNSGNPYINAIIVDNCNDYSIRKNTISNFSHTLNHMIGSAIFVKGDNNLNGSILENTIQNIKNTGNGIIRGIDIDLSNTNAANLLIANNMVSDVTSTGTTTNNANGILVRKGKDIKIYYNSVAMNGNQNNTSAALCLVDGSVFNIVNNIFTNTSNTGTPYAVYSGVANTAFANINYNDYYASNIGYLGSAKTTLTAWKTATGKDANSVNELPAFTSSTDLHLTASNCTLNGKGTPLAAIAVDIDNETRSTTAPDMGADEYNSEKCCTSTTWNGTDWSNNAPTINVKAIINGNYTTATANLNACELVVNSGFTLTITSNHFAKIQNNITVNGSLIVEDSGSLVQVDDAATTTGSISVKRKTSRMKLYDYTYWSSPVQGVTLHDVSPNTLADKYFSFNTATGLYVTSLNGVATMAPGQGYIIRAPQGWSATNETQGVFTATFNGVPNTGVIPVTIQKAGGNYNLIGNPYPSAIDIDAFLTDANNRNIVNGTVYVWTHNTAISSTTPGNYVYNYTSDDFAAYNLTGGVKTATAAISGGVVPNGKIASGQGFFIEANPALAAGSYTVNFNNSMRLTGNNSQFFRTRPSDPIDHAPIEKSRVWMSISNSEGGYNETLLGYITGATNEADNLYDGKTFGSNNALSLYSLIGNDKYSIQGRALPFTDSDVVKLGYKTTINGTFTIAIENTDGLFLNQDVFLVDKLNNTIQNLKTAAYSFTTVSGTFNDRFELRFVDASLAVENPIAATGLNVYTKDRQLFVQAASAIRSVMVYDLLGRTVYSQDVIDAPMFQSPALSVTNQVLVARVKMADATQMTRKIILN